MVDSADTVVVVEPVVEEDVVVDAEGVHPDSPSATTATRVQRGLTLTRLSARQIKSCEQFSSPWPIHMAKRASKRSALAMICAGSSMSFSWNSAALEDKPSIEAIPHCSMSGISTRS